MVLVQALILKELQRRQLQIRGLRLAVYTLYTLAIPASGVACLLWFITIHHFIMLYGTIWHHNQILICQRDAGRSSCSFTACPSRFDGWSHWWTGWWRVQISYQWVVELWLSTHRPMPRMCTMDDDIWLLSFRKKLWPPGMEEWQAYWDVTQWASQQKAWARTRLFFGLYSILNICILRSCLSHIPTYLYSIEIWHVHRIIYIYTYTHMHVWIRTYIECMQIYTIPVQIQGNMFCIFQLTMARRSSWTTAAELDKPAKCVAVRDPTCSWGNNHDKQSQYNDRYQ
jgi:hypothetical protein